MTASSISSHNNPTHYSSAQQSQSGSNQPGRTNDTPMLYLEEPLGLEDYLKGLMGNLS